MAWSENRLKAEIPFTKEQLQEKIKNVNAVLYKLSKDDDFQDDLKSPEVKRALDHWTGRNRLPPDEAMKLQDHRRCIYVLQRLQMLQHVCHDAHIAVPFDLMITGKDKLPESFVNATLGDLLAKAPSAADAKKSPEPVKISADKNNNNKPKALSPTATQTTPTPPTSTKPTSSKINEKKSEESTQKVEEKPLNTPATTTATTTTTATATAAPESTTTTTTTEKKSPAPNSLLMLAASVAVVVVSIIIVFISSRTKA